MIVVAPFFLIEDVVKALNLSTLCGILLLFLVGFTRAFDQNLLSKIMMGFASSCIEIIISVITVVLVG